jgi:hypothetical protein
MLVAPALLVGALFLAPYLLGRHVVPIGSDTPQGVWRARVAIDAGLDGLPPSGPALLDASTERPGLPVTMAIVNAVTGIDPTGQSFVLPAAIAAVIGLAAGALAVGPLAQPRAAFPIYAVLAGASLHVELMAAGYFDNLLAAAVTLAACTTILSVIDGRRGIAASIALLVAAALFHWMFAALFLTVLACLWIALLPVSARARRRGVAPLSTPAGRLTMIAGGALIAGGVGLALAPGSPAPAVGPMRSEVLAKLGRLAPSIVLPFAGALAFVGTQSLLRPADRGRGIVPLERVPVLRGQRRWGGVLLGAWAAVAVVAAVLVVVGIRLPAHRIVAFALAVPVLITTGLLVLVRRARSWRPIAGAAVLVLGAGALLAPTAASWLGRPAYANADRLSQIERIGAIVDRAPVGRPVVIVTDAPALPGIGATPAIRRVRAVVEPSRVGDVRAFVGSPADLLAGRPSGRPDDPAFEEASTQTWAALGDVADPIVVVPRLYHRGFAALAAGWPEAFADDALLVRGAPLPPEATASPAGPSVASLIFGTVGLVIVLGLAGLGWSWWLLDRPVRDRVALSPSIGLAVLAIVGFVADRAGMPIGGAGGAAVLIAAAAAGWVPVVGRRTG